MNAPLPKMTLHTKHIAVKYHWFRQHLKLGEIEAKKIGTKDQKADMFTKGLRVEDFVRLRQRIMGW